MIKASSPPVSKLLSECAEQQLYQVWLVLKQTGQLLTSVRLVSAMCDFLGCAWRLDVTAQMSQLFQLTFAALLLLPAFEDRTGRFIWSPPPPPKSSSVCDEMSVIVRWLGATIDSMKKWTSSLQTWMLDLYSGVDTDTMGHEPTQKAIYHGNGSYSRNSKHPTKSQNKVCRMNIHVQSPCMDSRG